MRNEEKFFGISSKITPWMNCSDFESYLAEEAGKSEMAKRIYAEYYRTLNPSYYEKGKEMAYIMMEERPHQFDCLDKETVYIDMVYSLHRFGYSFQDYCIYDFSNKTDSKRLEFVADKLRYHYCDILNAPEINHLMTDKYICYQTYKEFFKRTMVRVAERNDFSDFQQFVKSHPRFIFKPLMEHSGHGITILDSNKTDIEAWFNDTINNNPGVVEELIEQGEEMNKMNPHSVNSCRIVAFTDGKSVTMLGGALRMGCGNAITDNAGAGGIYASIDVATGKLQSDAQNYHNIHYSHHPTTGCAIKGFQLPNWDEASELIRRMSLKVKGSTLISWDIAYSTNGWIMVEANDNGDWSIIQSNLQKGKKKELFKYMEKYLDHEALPVHNTLDMSNLGGDNSHSFSAEEKNRIFIQRTKDLWPANWENFLDLIQHEKWTKEELQAYNFRKRLEMLKFAYENTVFYKRLYDGVGLNPNDIKTESDWTQVPIVTKQMIADYSREFEVEGAVEKYGFSAHTGGSTGKPLRVFRDRRHFWQAPWWRFYGWHLGRKCGETDINIPIWGLDDASIDRSYYRATPEWIRNREVAFWPKKFINLSPYAEFSQNVDHFISELSKSPLAKIYAYAGGLDMFTDYCIEKGIHFSNVSFIEACASPLTPTIREKVSKVFDCKVFDFYASNEMGPMAVECHKSGNNHHLHVLSDLLDIELVDNNGQLVKGKELGSTVVTCFTNKVFPFVRYNHGDKTHWIREDCKCGLPFPTIAPVRGRNSEHIMTKKGMALDGVGFNEAFDFYPEAVTAFQFRQKENGHVTLLVVPNKNYGQAMDEISSVIKKLRDDFKGEIEFDLQYVDSIAHEGGKMRYIIHE